MSRPAVLFPLFAGAETLPGVGAKTAKSLEQIDITRPRDMLFTLPLTGIDRALRDTIQGVAPPATVTVEVTIGAHVPPRRKGGPARVFVRDAKTEFQLVFFHARGDFLSRHLPTGQRRVVSGKLEIFDGLAQIVHPDHILRPEEAGDLPAFEPVYPLTAGVSQKAMQKAAEGALARLPDLAEWADPQLLAREGWPAWADALRAVHRPACLADLSVNAPARQRLAYDELFAHQVTLALARASVRRGKGRASRGDGRLRQAVLAALPYRPTGAQDRAVAEIVADMAADTRMNRLLQGDVGSGKTLVAFLALLNAVEAGGQGVMMAPTEILARQHLEGLRPLAESAGVRLEILTGRDRGAERAARIADLAAGRISILVGTHAVFQKDVEFADLRLAIIDEQHRFGVIQRAALRAKGTNPDVLVMTATPIPRTLGMTVYGDLDISVIDELPPGKKPIKTKVFFEKSRAKVYDIVRGEVEKGNQVFIVYPLVEESEALDLKDATTMATHLQKDIFPDLRVGLIHGRMKGPEKEAVMDDFKNRNLDILVSTTVIEVGIDIPDASLMVVEHAERFGLSQLHQLRGRVGRSSLDSYCALMAQHKGSADAKKRLRVMEQTNDGFKIAEEDLLIRGPGEFMGTKQSGLPDFRVASILRDTATLNEARREAFLLIEKDPNLEKPEHRALQKVLMRRWETRLEIAKTG